MKKIPSKSKILIWKFIPITHSIIYHHQKNRKSVFPVQKLMRVLKLVRVLSDKVFFRLLSDKTFLRFLSDRVLSRVLSDRVLFDSSVISSSSGSSMIDSSCSSSVLFFRFVALFYKNVVLLFRKKQQMFCFTLYFQKEVHWTISLTCFNNFNKNDSEKYEKILAW